MLAAPGHRAATTTERYGHLRYAVQNDYIDSTPAGDMAGALATTKARHSPASSHIGFLSSLTVLSLIVIV